MIPGGGQEGAFEFFLFCAGTVARLCSYLVEMRVRIELHPGHGGKQVNAWGGEWAHARY